jgi:hypothetical protein
MKIQLVRALSGRRRAPVSWLIVAVITLLSSAVGIEFHRARAAAESDASTVAQSTGFLIFVNTTGDGDNTVAAPNCDADAVTPGAQCTLRAAIQASNLAAGDDAIEFVIPPTDPNCDSTGKCIINLHTELPHLSTGVELINTAADKLTVRRDTTDPFSIFTVTLSGKVTISGLTVSNGRPGIFIEDGGTVSINNSVVSENRYSGWGAGIFNVGTLTITNSSISNNSAGAKGGGIFNAATLTIINSTVSGNQSSRQGGGIANTNGTVTVANSTISDNFISVAGLNFSGGGGIFNDLVGSVTITNSTISNNDGSGSGGGIYNFSDAPVIVKSSIIASNEAGPTPTPHSRHEPPDSNSGGSAITAYRISC